MEPYARGASYGIIAAVVYIFIAYMLAGCATAKPGPWVYQDGTWCQSNTSGCHNEPAQNERPWYNFGLSDQTWSAINGAVVNMNGVKH